MAAPTKIALITGGSRGIGAATARVLAHQGYRICINYRDNHQAATALQQELLAICEHVVIKQADVAKESEAVELFEFIDEHLGSITALVNNAGILKQQCRLQDLTAERINEVLLTRVC
jgi:NAD(P)-dependent dehydrogenase (short-subunit alcohol dehydrogenase family)